MSPFISLFFLDIQLPICFQQMRHAHCRMIDTCPNYDDTENAIVYKDADDNYDEACTLH